MTSIRCFLGISTVDPPPPLPAEDPAPQEQSPEQEAAAKRFLHAPGAEAPQGSSRCTAGPSQVRSAEGAKQPGWLWARSPVLDEAPSFIQRMTSSLVLVL